MAPSSATPTPLSDVKDFGQIEAESDELLEASFADHPALHAVLNDRRFLVLGRKGAGKTAIYRSLLGSGSPTRFLVGYSFADYPWQYHDKLQSAEAVEQERYLHSWKYLFLLATAKLLVNQDESRHWSPQATAAIADIEDFLRKTYGTTDPTLADIFAPSSKQSFFERLTFDFKILKLNTATLKHNNAGFFQEFNKQFEVLILQALNPANEYYICFDELDRGFDPSSQQYKQRLIGLLMAARDLARANQAAGKQLKPAVFLRSDIFSNHLFFEDKNKLIDTHSTTIDWEYAGGPTLKALMNGRIHARTGIDSETAWEWAFDETKEMRGRQSKYTHILSHTLLRPRDIIKFCNCILAAYKLRKPDPREKFSNEDVNQARREFSRHFKRELEDESFQYIPGGKTMWEVIRQPGTQIITREQLAGAFDAWKANFPPELKMTQLIQILFELSILGFKRTGGQGGGSSFVFKYTDADTECNTSASEFKIHSGLVEALNIKRYSRTSEIEFDLF